MSDQSGERDIKLAKCASCDVALKPGGEHDPETWWACPACGNGDTYENVIAELNRFCRDQAAKALNEQIRGIASRSKIIRVDNLFSEGTGHRFKIDCEAG